MHRYWSTLLLFSCLLTLSSRSQKVDICFLQLNDVYEMSAVSGGQFGGLARVQTLLDSLKRQNPHTYSVLAGDLLSPSAIGTATYNGQKLAGRQMVDILDSMRWDYFILGNHEFDVKEKDLRQRLKEMDFPVIAYNVRDANDKRFPNTVDTIMLRVEGVSMGLFGVTLNSFNTKYAHISDPVAAAREATRELHERGADIIIGLTHQSIESDIVLAESVPKIDLIMGGHEHENYHLLRGIDYTPIAKADANAKSAFVHRLSYDVSTGELDIHSELVLLDARIEEDPTIAKQVERWQNIAFQSFEEAGFSPEEVICVSNAVLNGSESAVRSKSTGLTTLIAKSFSTAFPTADASILNGGSIRIDDWLPPGPITQYDVLRISPFGGDVSLVEMNGATLIRTLEQGLKNSGTGAFLHYDRIAQKGNDWYVQDKQIDVNAPYLIAIPTYMVEQGDQNLGFLTSEDLVKRMDVPKVPFFDAVVNQFKRSFPKK